MRAKVLGAAAALAIAASGAQAVVYTYDGDFIVDTGPGTPNEIDLTLTLPDSLFLAEPTAGTEAYAFSYSRTSSAEVYRFNGQIISAEGIVLPDLIANSDPDYAGFYLGFDARADVVSSLACFQFLPTEYCHDVVDVTYDRVYFDGVEYRVPQNDWVRVGDPLPPVSPVPLPASGLILFGALVGSFGLRRARNT